MSKWIGLIAVAIMATGLVYPSSAKPPQLPVPSEVHCQKEEGQRRSGNRECCAPAVVEIRHPRGTIEFRAAVIGHPAGAVVTVDGSGATWISQCWRSLCRVFESDAAQSTRDEAVPAQQVDDSQTGRRDRPAVRSACPTSRGCCEGRSNAVPYRSDIQVKREVRELYEQADEARRHGNWQHAYRLYEEIHLRLPNSRYGQVAKQWLARIEEQGNAVAATAVSEQSPDRDGVFREVARRRCEEAQRQVRAAGMFQTAELCRHAGNFDAAYERYREVIRIAPESELADMARARLQRFQELRYDVPPDVPHEPDAPPPPLETIPGPIGWIHVPAWPMPVIVPASCPHCPDSEPCQRQSSAEGSSTRDGNSQLQYDRILGGIGPE